MRFDGGVSNVIAAGRQAAGRADCDGRETALMSWTEPQYHTML